MNSYVRFAWAFAILLAGGGGASALLQLKGNPENAQNRRHLDRDNPSGGALEVGDKASDNSNAKVSKSDFYRLDDREKFQNLTRRISNIRSEIESSRDPGALVAKIFSDMRTLDSFSRKTISGSLENQLAEIEPDSNAKLVWLAEVLPEIRYQLGSFSFDGKTSEQHTFSLLATNISSLGLNAEDEIGKIKDSGKKSLMVENLLPHLIIQTNDPHSEIIDALDAETKAQTFQNVFAASAAYKMYQSESLKIYLDGLGTAGLHEEVVSKWFNDPSWFWLNSERTAEMISQIAPGPRKDLVISALIKNIRKTDPESAKKWLPMISDDKLANRLSTELGQ